MAVSVFYTQIWMLKGMGVFGKNKKSNV